MGGCASRPKWLKDVHKNNAQQPSLFQGDQGDPAAAAADDDDGGQHQQGGGGGGGGQKEAWHVDETKRRSLRVLFHQDDELMPSRKCSDKQTEAVTKWKEEQSVDQTCKEAEKKVVIGDGVEAPLAEKPIIQSITDDHHVATSSKGKQVVVGDAMPPFEPAKSAAAPEVITKEEDESSTAPPVTTAAVPETDCSG